MSMWLDTNPNVIRWSSESFAIGYYNPVKCRMARYYPDYTADIRNKDGKVIRYLIEVKPKEQTTPPVPKPRQTIKTKMWAQAQWLTNEAKWKAAEKFSRDNGYIFKLITEVELFGRQI